MAPRLEFILLLFKPPCFSYVSDVVLILTSRNVHKKSSEAFIKIKINKVNSSLTFIQTSVNYGHKRKWSTSRLLSFPHSRKYPGCGWSRVC